MYTSNCVGCTKVCKTPNTKGYTGWKWYVTSCFNGLAGIGADWKCAGCSWKRSRSGQDRAANLIGTSLNDRGRTCAEMSFSSKMNRLASRNGLAHRLWADAGMAPSIRRVTYHTHTISWSTTRHVMSVQETYRALLYPCWPQVLLRTASDSSNPPLKKWPAGTWELGVGEQDASTAHKAKS